MEDDLQKTPTKLSNQNDSFYKTKTYKTQFVNLIRAIMCSACFCLFLFLIPYIFELSLLIASYGTNALLLTIFICVTIVVFSILSVSKT
jgi:hypothetical protein